MDLGSGLLINPKNAGTLPVLSADVSWLLAARTKWAIPYLDRLDSRVEGNTVKDLFILVVTVKVLRRQP